MAKLPPFETPFDSYTSVGVIGEGGAGMVYEVRNAAGETFALKCLAPERVNAERLKRFKNEIAFCQRQAHPNIVKVLDTGATSIKGVKVPFYVMRRYTGTLRTHMGGLQAGEALKAFSQLLNGVEAAHLSNVWHRDVKPENVLWDQAGASLVLSDFGIAHFEVEEIYTAVETKAASRLANFLYSAPEQRVRGAKVDHRADIFSLGLILNELFTGEVPQGSGFKRVASVSAEHSYIDELVDGMIQQDPQKRPQSIEEIKKELIGRKNAFVAMQQYEATKKQVVATGGALEFEPITLVGLDYSRGMLTLQLSRNVPAGWAQEFHNQRGGHSAILGYGPEAFQVRGNTLTLNIRDDERLVQEVVNHAKNYVAAANRGYVQQQQELNARNEREQRQALERAVAEADLRRNILKSVKL
jgi:serine/threonine protein kinase